MMKVGKNSATILFSAITIINLAIFFYRDKFTYHKYATRSSLYSTDTLRWKKFIDDYSKQELIEAKIILDSLLDIENKSTSSKILEIGKLLYQRFHKQLGKPSHLVSAATPLNQFKILDSSHSERLWCGNFAAIFVFFCWSEGIPCRFIEIVNPGNHHVLSECYLSESKEWALTDITTNHLLLFNRNRNKFENLLNVRDTLMDSLQSLQMEEGEIVTKPFIPGFYDTYFGHGNPIYYYYRINNFEVYKSGEKIKRYFLPITWYEEVNRKVSGNFLFYVKQSLILLWLFCLIFLARQFLSTDK
jgi:hypothetical protein